MNQPLPNDDVRLDVAREAQARWRLNSVQERIAIIRRLRHRIAANADELADAVEFPARNGRAESLASEVIPLADACRFLEREAVRILAAERPSKRNRPGWLRGVGLTLVREPLGVILILGAANYPLFLAGVQTLQALVAGNAVLLKPAPGATQSVEMLKAWLVEAGLDNELIQLLDPDPASARVAIREGVDKVVLTGSAATGRAVLAGLVETLTPATVELSGCDAVFVLPSADTQLVAKALAFGLTFNSGATCIAPRRVFVGGDRIEEVAKLTIECLEQRLKAVPCGEIVATEAQRQLVAEAVQGGAACLYGGVDSTSGIFQGPTILTTSDVQQRLLQSDVFAPVLTLIPVESMEDAIEKNACCPYALGAAVFGASDDASQMAMRIPAGCVVINDMIAPTADPRIPFGGAGESGYGVTRGAAGLEEMTRIKAIVEQRSKWLPHLDPTSPHDADLLAGFAQFTHGETMFGRMAGLRRLITAAMAQRKWAKDN